MSEHPTLFGPAPVEHYDVRWDSPSTSREAAASIAPVRTALHQAVLSALREGGPMTDEQLERLPQFRELGPSTIRKRRSELAQQHPPAVVAVGEASNTRGRRMIVWGVA